MRGVINILENDATLAAMLGDGANSVFSDIATQGESIPYVIAHTTEIVPTNTFGGSAPMDEVFVSVLSISDRKYSSGGVSGSFDMAARIRTLLEAASGTYASDVIKDTMLNSESPYTERHGDRELSVIDQTYQIFLER